MVLGFFVGQVIQDDGGVAGQGCASRSCQGSIFKPLMELGFADIQEELRIE